jgi:hypothetical protein
LTDAAAAAAKLKHGTLPAEGESPQIGDHYT